MNRVNKLIRCSLLLLVFIGFTNQIVYAEQIDTSVYDNLKNGSNAVESNKEPNDPLTNNEDSTEVNQSSSIGVTLWEIVKMVFATIFVVVLMYMILRFINKRNQVYKSSQLVENLGGTALGANRSIQMIKVGNRVFIVGVGENIQLLKEIEDKEECNKLLQDYNQKLEQYVQPSDIVTKVKKLLFSNSASVKKEPFSSRLEQELGKLSKARKEKLDAIEKKGSTEKNE